MISEPHILQQQRGIPSTTPPKYNRKPPDSSAPKITRPCTECGKKFWSWKALFGHMRCHPERQWRGINPPPNYIREPPPATTTTTTSSQLMQHQKDRYFLGTLEEANNMSEEEHELAACLLMLANRDDNGNGGGCSASQTLHHDQEAPCRFECPSCKKVFGSHQALGGHRASHKNVKGCFTIRRTSYDDCQIPAAGDHVKENLEKEEHNMMVALGHKCDVCLRVFSSGLALGGHKRCHWEKADEASSSMLNHQFSRGPNTILSKQAGSFGLDLNLPSSTEHDSASSSTLTLDLRLGL